MAPRTSDLRVSCVPSTPTDDDDPVSQAQAAVGLYFDVHLERRKNGAWHRIDSFSLGASNETQAKCEALDVFWHRGWEV